MKPFMEQFWAACEKELPSNARHGMVWHRQVHSALVWILGFLRQQHGPLIREWKLSSYIHASAVITVTFDASPWGLGGVIFRNGIPLQYFRDPLTYLDERRVGFKIGDHRGQQVVEALAILVSLRFWRALWVSSRTSLVLQGTTSQP